MYVCVRVCTGSCSVGLCVLYLGPMFVTLNTCCTYIQIYRVYTCTCINKFWLLVKRGIKAELLQLGLPTCTYMCAWYGSPTPVVLSDCAVAGGGGQKYRFGLGWGVVSVPVPVWSEVGCTVCQYQWGFEVGGGQSASTSLV